MTDAYTKERRREYNREYYRKWVDSVIQGLGGVCVSCGTSEKLEIDHIDETTKVSVITKMWSFKDKELVEKEIQKCQLLCKRCHLNKTIPFLREAGLKQGITHGTYYAFQRKKCQCNVCYAGKLTWYKARNLRRNAMYGERKSAAGGNRTPNPFGIGS